MLGTLERLRNNSCTVFLTRDLLSQDGEIVLALHYLTGVLRSEV